MKRQPTRTKEHGANTGAVKVLVSRKPGESQHWKRVVRETLGLRNRQVLNFNLGSRNCCESDNEVVLTNGYVGGAEMMPELVLTGEAEKEAIEFDLS